MIPCSTERLILREFSLNDAPFVYELLNSAGWLQYIGDRTIRSIEDAQLYIEKHYLPSYVTNGYGAYIVSLKSTGELIGCCGLYKRDTLDHPDIGFALLKKFWHMGYAYEAASTIVKFATEELGFQTILGITMPDNKSSIKLLEKLGLQKIDTIRMGEEDEELLLFSYNSMPEK